MADPLQQDPDPNGTIIGPTPSAGQILAEEARRPWYRRPEIIAGIAVVVLAAIIVIVLR